MNGPKVTSVDVAVAYSNGTADLMLSKQIAGHKIASAAAAFAESAKDRLHSAVIQAAAEGAAGIRITWTAPKIEVLK